MTTLVEKQTRRKRKNLAKARKLGGPSSEVIAYGSGVRKARFSPGLIILVGGYIAVSVAVLVLTGKFLIPGVLLIIIGASILRPRRGIAVTPGGLLVMHESAVDAAPNRILFGIPLEALTAAAIQDQQGAVQTSVDLELGTERIRMKRSSFETLLLATRDLPSSSASGGVAESRGLPGPAWCPDPTGRYEYRYWDGLSWTPHVSTGGSTFVDSLA
jgi:hypothetical protein